MVLSEKEVPMQMMTKRAPDGVKNGIMGLTCQAFFCFVLVDLSPACFI